MMGGSCEGGLRLGEQERGFSAVVVMQESTLPAYEWGRRQPGKRGGHIPSLELTHWAKATMVCSARRAVVAAGSWCVVLLGNWVAELL